MANPEDYPIVGFQYNFAQVVSRPDAEYALFSIPTKDEIYPHRIANIFGDGHIVTAEVHIFKPTSDRKNLANNLISDAFYKAIAEYPAGFTPKPDTTGSIITDTIEGTVKSVGRTAGKAGEGVAEGLGSALPQLKQFGIIAIVLIGLLIVGFFIVKKGVA